jgi:hypothetical protein
MSDRVTLEVAFTPERDGTSAFGDKESSLSLKDLQKTAQAAHALLSVARDNCGLNSGSGAALWRANSLMSR